ncbi:MAG: glycosyltransferase [Candidatus Omnitrophota bacterium]
MQVHNLRRKITERWRAHWLTVFGYPVIRNANKVRHQVNKKRALLIYLVNSFTRDMRDPLYRQHQNLKQCRQIVSVLDEAGYVVDVVDYRDEKFVPRRAYDLVISHRTRHPYNVALFGDKAYKVYLSSGMSHFVHNLNVMRRHAALLERRGSKLDTITLNTEDLSFLSKAQAIIGFGNDYTMGSWKAVFSGDIYPFNNYALEDTQLVLDKKNFHDARKKFLFFASGPQLRKGLDLLLEAFLIRPEYDLYVCSRFQQEKDFCKLYHKELFETANIHPVGFVNMNSQRFYELCEKCAYVILPSAEEGQAGSVVQCMAAGLIPVVTPEVGIDVEGYGVRSDLNSVENIIRVLDQLVCVSDQELREQTIRTRQICDEQYSEPAFINRWRKIITDIDGVRAPGKVSLRQ